MEQNSSSTKGVPEQGQTPTSNRHHPQVTGEKATPDPRSHLMPQPAPGPHEGPPQTLSSSPQASQERSCTAYSGLIAQTRSRMAGRGAPRSPARPTIGSAARRRCQRPGAGGCWPQRLCAPRTTTPRMQLAFFFPRTGLRDSQLGAELSLAPHPPLRLRHFGCRGNGVNKRKKTALTTRDTDYRERGRDRERQKREDPDME